MVIEIALGIVLGVILLALLPFILVLAWYALLFALGIAVLILLGWGAYELYEVISQELALRLDLLLAPYPSASA
jgi:hypothetical protein